MRTTRSLIAGALILGLSQPADAKEPSTATDEVRATTVEALAREFEKGYVYPEIGAEVAMRLRESLASGSYDGVGSGEDFASRLLASVNAVVADKHFMLWYSEQPLEGEMKPGPGYAEAQRLFLRRHNGFIRKVEHLPGNLGYLKVDALFDPEHIADQLAGALRFLQNVDALIIDIRDNGGGVPEAVQLVVSHLLPARPVLLMTHYWRPTDESTEFWSLEEGVEPRLPDTPVLILTSSETASGAEGLAYVLKHLGRATLVGERTWGGSHPGTTVRLSQHFAAVIPMGHSTNPITGGDWEGQGVEPHIEVPAADALDRAQQVAIERLLDDPDLDESWRSTLEERVLELGERRTESH